MNSKEALNKLKIMPPCSECENYGECFGKPLCNELYDIISKDLDRLEKLEKVIEILKIFNFTLYIVKDNNETSFRIYTNHLLETQVITKEEYELLKGVLENVKD